jgi:hypothetical protein
MSLVEAALELAARGIPVFPCKNIPSDRDQHKKPLTTHGFKDATTNADEIQRWWRLWPNALIGMPTGPASGISMLDLDIDATKNKNGYEKVPDWESRSTAIARTGRGGAHLYYKADGAPGCTTDQIAHGVDTRGSGGYAIVPPSEGYTWVKGDLFTELPPWPDDLRPPPRPEITSSSEPQTHDWKIMAVALALPNDDLGRDEWNRIGMAFHRASGGSDFGLEQFTFWSAKSAKHHPENNTCRKRWQHWHQHGATRIGAGTLIYLAEQADPDWIQHFDAEMSRRWNSAHDASNSSSLQSSTSASASSQSNASIDDPFPKARRHGESESSHSMQWAIKNLFPRKGVGLLSGQWGAGKTYVALDLAGSVILVAEEFFIDYRIKRHGGVLFIAAEGVSSIGLRFEAMLAKKLGHSIDDQGPPQPFAWVNFQPRLLKMGDYGLTTIAKREAKWMKETHNVDLTLIIIDTVAAAAAFDREDDAAQAQSVMSALGRLSAASGAFVLGVDHFGKNEDAGTRGSSAKEAYAETVLALVGKRAITGRVTDLKMGVRKVRDGDSGREIPFRLQVIDCGVDEDGDQITTCVVHWEPDRPTQQSSGRPRNHGTMITALRRAIERNGTTITHDGCQVRAARVDHVRNEFKNLLRENQETDLTDNAVKKKWLYARASALECRVVRSVTFEEYDYLWEIDEEPM